MEITGTLPAVTIIVNDENSDLCSLDCPHMSRTGQKGGKKGPVVFAETCYLFGGKVLTLTPEGLPERMEACKENLPTPA